MTCRVQTFHSCSMCFHTCVSDEAYAEAIIWEQYVCCPECKHLMKQDVHPYEAIQAVGTANECC